MFRAAAGPKELWVVHGAEHVDLCRYAGAAYRVHVLGFFGAYLRGRSRTAREEPRAWFEATCPSIDARPDASDRNLCIHGLTKRTLNERRIETV